MNTLIKDVLHSKGDAVYGVEIRTVVAEAIKRMAKYGIGSVLVFDGKLVVGILTERDLVRRVLFQGVDPATTAVEDMMTVDIAYVAPEMTVAMAMKLMLETRCRHLPVFAEGQLISVVSLN